MFLFMDDVNGIRDRKSWY